MEFPRQEYWSGLPFPSPGNPLDLGMEPGSPALQVDSLLTEPPGKPTNPLRLILLSSRMWSFDPLAQKAVVAPSWYGLRTNGFCLVFQRCIGR